MDKHDLDVRLTVAEARLARMTKRLKYLRGSELYGYEDAGAYRQALHEYHAAQRELLALRGGAAATRCRCRLRLPLVRRGAGGWISVRRGA